TLLGANITFSPIQPRQGVTVTVRAIVLNTGATPAEEVTVQFLDVTNGVLLPIGDRQTIDLIPPGGSAQVEVGYVTSGPAGERRVQVVVDPNNFIREQNERDNEATQNLTVISSPMPNVTIAAGNVVFNPPQPTEGDVVTVT